MRTSAYRPARSVLWATMVCGGTLFLLSILSGHAASRTEVARNSSRHAASRTESARNASRHEAIRTEFVRNLSGHAPPSRTELASFYDEFLNKDYRGESPEDMPTHTQDALEKYLKEKRAMKLAGGAAGGVGALGLFLGLLASILHVKGAKKSLSDPGASSSSGWLKTREATLGERAIDALRPADKNWYNPLWKGAAGLGALLLLSSFGLIFAALQARNRNKANRMVYRQLLQRVGSRGGAAEFDETVADFDWDSVSDETRGPKMVSVQSRTPGFYPRPQMGSQVVDEQRKSSTGFYPSPEMDTREEAEQSRTSGFYPRVQMGTRARAGGLQESLAGIAQRPMDHEWLTNGRRLPNEQQWPSQAEIPNGQQWPSQAESDSSSVTNDE